MEAQAWSMARETSIVRASRTCGLSSSRRDVAGHEPAQLALDSATRCSTEARSPLAWSSTCTSSPRGGVASMKIRTPVEGHGGQGQRHEQLGLEPVGLDLEVDLEGEARPGSSTR